MDAGSCNVKESEDRGMQEVTFEVETITPLFLAGADQAWWGQDQRV